MGVEESITVRMALLRTRAERRDGAVRDEPPRRARRVDGSRDAEAPRPPIVELRDATVVYPGGHVGVERVSFALERGEFAFVVGPTGCGKSTLIKMLIREVGAGQRRGADRRPGHQPPARPPPSASAPACRHGVPGLQAAAQPHRLRQRRLRPPGDRRQPRRHPAQGSRDPPPGWSSGQGPQLSGPALRWRAAARLDRACIRQPPAAPARGRADREPGSRDLRSESCSSCTGSTAPGRPCSSPRTTARWWTGCAAG